jgi:hypothetical protein
MPVKHQRVLLLPRQTAGLSFFWLWLQTNPMFNAPSENRDPLISLAVVSQNLDSRKG